MNVGVVLLNWNSGDLTSSCIESLLAGSVKPLRIVVFDNASTDGSPERIAVRFPGVTLMRSADNVGFTGGNNAAIKTLLGESTDAVWILNNDTVVDPQCLAALLNVMQHHPETGVVTGKIFYRDPPRRLWYAGGDLRRVSCGGHHRGLGEFDQGAFDQERPVSFVSGCCMLVRGTALHSLGLFHPQYFAYDEDVEWCWRAAARQVVMRYTPRAVLLHDVSASMRKNAAAPGVGSITAEAHYLESRNRIFTLRLHARGMAGWCGGWLGYLVKTIWVLGGLGLLRRGAKFRARLQGIRDGLRTELAGTRGNRTGI